MNTSEALNYVVSRVESDLKALGMIRNKKGDLWTIKNNSSKCQLQINVSPGLSNKSGYIFHTTLAIYRDDLSLYVMGLENFLREKKSMPPLSIKRALFSITDWLDSFQENGKIDNGIWFARLEEIQADMDFERKFKELAELSIDFFSESKKLDFCMNHLINKGYAVTNLTFLALASSVSGDFLHKNYVRLRGVNLGRGSWDDLEMNFALHFIEENPFKPKYPFQ